MSQEQFHQLPIHQPSVNQEAQQIQDSHPSRYSKRGRNEITNEDLLQLEMHFSVNPYPTIFQKKQIAKNIGLTQKNVMEWFVNKQSSSLATVDDASGYVYFGAKRGRAKSQNSNYSPNKAVAAYHAGHYPHTPAAAVHYHYQDNSSIAPPQEPMFDLPKLNLSTFTDVYGSRVSNLPGDFRDRIHLAAGMALPDSPAQTPIVSAVAQSRPALAMKRGHDLIDRDNSPLQNQQEQDIIAQLNKKRAVPFNLIKRDEGDDLLSQFVDLPSSSLSPRCTFPAVVETNNSHHLIVQAGNIGNSNARLLITTANETVDVAASHPNINETDLEFLANFLS